MIYRSRYPDPVIPRSSLPDYVLAAAASHSAHPALIDGTTGDTLTYGDLRRLVPAIAQSLAAVPVRPGDVVALMAPNRPAWAAAFYGALTAGATITALVLTLLSAGRGSYGAHALSLLLEIGTVWYLLSPRVQAAFRRVAGDGA